jgi:hypothetical protein
MAWNNLAWVREKLGDSAEAISCYQEALRIDESHAHARRNLACLFLRQGAALKARALLQRELSSGAAGYEWCSRAVTDALVNQDFQLAGAIARVIAELRWGSRWFPRTLPPGEEPPDVPRPDRFLTVAKLRHDIRQLEYLEARGLLGFDSSPYRRAYSSIAERLEASGIRNQVPLSPADEDAIGEIYNRLLYIRETPRVGQALSSNWSGLDVGRRYGAAGAALVVIDDFLSAEALEELRAFCLESTVWSANRYAHGRLGAFFHDGFNCPLLLQIAEELRAAMPDVIRPEYPLRQLWAFKNSEVLPSGATLHADFAAVNVNFWITPESANQDVHSGGMDIYDVSAPLWWDFMSYNGRSDLMQLLLRDRDAHAVPVSYRANRAIIFNSDLFHATQAVNFTDGYADHRINVTLLFGDRERDTHFAQPAHAIATIPGDAGA